MIWKRVRALHSKMTRTVQTWLALVVIVAGVSAAGSWLSAADIPNVSRYAYGDRGTPSKPVRSG